MWYSLLELMFFCRYGGMGKGWGWGHLGARLHSAVPRRLVCVCGGGGGWREGGGFTIRFVDGVLLLPTGCCGGNQTVLRSRRLHAPLGLQQAYTVSRSVQQPSRPTVH